MTHSSSRLAFAIALAISLASGTAAAAKPERHAALYQNMDGAGERYREARIKLQGGDDAAMAEMNRALEDLEDLAQQCLKLKGCDATRVFTQYETLIKSQDLKANPQELAGEDSGDLDDPDHVESPIVAGSPEAQRTLSLLADGHDFDKMVELNQPVQAAMREWLTSQRAFLTDAWENYQYMRYLMAPEYERAGLPEALLFGIMAKESGGKVHAVSRAGATGPLQFMPATGSRFGLYKDGTGFDTRYDPQQAARANAAYINERFRELNRNLEYTVAAYTGGEGRAARMYQANAGASFWSPEVYAKLPPETRDYVPAVIAAAWLFLHPKKYGLEFPKVDTTPTQFSLVHASSINELTICLGNGGTRDGFFRVLRNLNPRYEPGAPIAAGTTLRAPKKVATLYQRHCTKGPRAALAQELVRANKSLLPGGEVMVATVAAPRKKQPNDYRVRPGDSLIAIAREHSCDVSELAKANRLRSPAYMIRPGQRLKLKGCGEG